MITEYSDSSQSLNGTMHYSNATGMRIAFFFQGNEIYYYGGKGPGYGTVAISVDGVKPYEEVNASSSTVQYKQLLWSRTGLPSGDHQIMINRDSGQVSLDYFRVVSFNDTIVPSLTGPGASVVPKDALIVDDDDINAVITYSPAWERIENLNGATSPGNVGFHKNTVHRTTTPGAVATFTFNGTAVWYFSDIDSTHGMVQISFDGEQPERVSGFHNPILSQRLIWHKTGLSPSLHQVTITHDGTPRQYATVDFFGYLPRYVHVFYERTVMTSLWANTSNATAMIPGGTASSTDTESKRGNFRVAAITGIVIGILALVGALYGIYLVYRRRVHWARLVPKQLRRGMRPTQGVVDRTVQYESIPFTAIDPNYASGSGQNHWNKLPNRATGTSIYDSTLTTVSDTSYSPSIGNLGNSGSRNHYEMPPPYQRPSSASNAQ
ncbi:hypothetical protein RHS03_09077, partial [Rhizoctonia solani]